MEFRNTIEVLHANAEEIKQLMARLEKRNEISTIELDLILEKLRSIYDLVLDMQTSITDKGNNEAEIIQKTGSESDKSTEQKLQDRKSMAKEQIERDLRKPEIKDEEKATRNNFVSDRFRTTKSSINDELAAKAKSNEISSGLKSKPVSSITNSMGLNEKLEIINELFGGDKDKFELTIQKLNMAGSFVEAYNYLNSTFNWDMDNSYVQRILELIRRKLIVKRDEQ